MAVKGTLTLGDLVYDVYETRAFVQNQNMRNSCLKWIKAHKAC